MLFADNTVRALWNKPEFIMSYPILMAIALTGWAFMSLLAGERTRRENERASLPPVEPASPPDGSPATRPSPKAAPTPPPSKTVAPTVSH